MKIRIVLASLIALAFAPVNAAGQSATSCLSTANSSNCLANVALKLLFAEKSEASKVNGYESLISSLTRTGLRRDDIFKASELVETESASIADRWSLSMARRGYALRFLDTESGLESLGRLEATAFLLRRRLDGFERVQIIDSACEARESIPATVLLKWEGMLDRLCRLDASDADAIDKELPGLSAIVSTMVNAYNKDDEALTKSLAVSFEILTRYEAVLHGKLSQKEREVMRGVLFLGHFLNAIALVTANQAALARKELQIAMGHLAKAPSIAKSPEFAFFVAYESWILAKAGFHEEALKSLRRTLDRVDRINKSRGSEKVQAIATSIETLDLLNSDR